MGKYAATRGFQRETKDWKGSNQTLDNNDISRWLYGEWSKDKLRQYELLDKIPVLSGYMDYLLDVRGDEEYMRRYQLDYSDIHDPRKLRQSKSGFSGIGTILQVSANVASLYK